MNSFLVCRHGGLIEPLDSGQDLIYEEEPVMEELNDENNILGLISGILESLSNMVNICYVGKKILNVLDTKFEIIQKEDYYIIKDSREKRKEIEDFKKIKGTRYKIGSDKFKEARLNKYLPKGQHSKMDILNKTKDNFTEISKNKNFFKGTLRFTTKKSKQAENPELGLDVKVTGLEKFDNVLKGLDYLSMGLDMAKSVDDNIKKGETRASEYITDAGIEALKGVTSMAISTGCTSLGVAIGSAIPIPGIGTVIGAGVGYAIGYVGGKLFDLISEPLGNIIDNYI